MQSVRSVEIILQLTRTWLDKICTAFSVKVSIQYQYPTRPHRAVLDHIKHMTYGLAGYKKHSLSQCYMFLLNKVSSIMGRDDSWPATVPKLYAYRFTRPHSLERAYWNMKYIYFIKQIFKYSCPLTIAKLIITVYRYLLRHQRQFSDKTISH